MHHRFTGRCDVVEAISDGKSVTGFVDTTIVAASRVEPQVELSRLTILPEVLYIVVRLMGYVMDWNWMSMEFKVLRLGVSFGITRLIRASFWITRLICASFGITRLICASLGITRLIGVSFRITRLIRASFGITGLMCAFYGTTRLFTQGYSEGQIDEGQEGCVKAIWTRLVFFMLPLMYFCYSLFSLVGSSHV
ncbi:hypothetical protein E6C27_scaffold219G00350 [Cucumis melo var. makuwa]|uniref:Uncharacterized protein n=1 Tax=Cucumis melo var. makuwa TaxID=1194695 RepID=A0A5A7SRQ9_CUCMM|nr:hypothetical protein E6C27_scaffold219G00350 [Cucumis melo var. makuwa]